MMLHHYGTLGGTTVIVGNGRSLLGSQNGERIDGYDTVIRLNYGPTNGYETDVGSRTTARMINKMMMDGRSPRWSEVPPPNWIGIVENETLIMKPNVAKMDLRKAKQRAEQRNKIIEWTDRGRQEMLDFQKRNQPYSISTGLLAAYAFYHLPATERLDLIGFDGYSDNVEEKVHYFEDLQVRDLTNQHHNWQWERNKLKECSDEIMSVGC